MRDNRGSNGRKTLGSFDELRKEFGLKKIRYKTKDKKKLESQQNKFKSKHVCSACGEPLDLIEGTNIMVCKNPECKGIENQYIDRETGEKKTRYLLSFQKLDERGSKIANNILKQGEKNE